MFQRIMDVQIGRICNAWVHLLLLCLLAFNTCYSIQTNNGEDEQFQLIQQIAMKMDDILNSFPRFESRLESVEKKLDGDISKVTEKLNAMISSQEDMVLRKLDNSQQFTINNVVNVSRPSDPSTESSIKQGFQNLTTLSTQLLESLQAITNRQVSEKDHLKIIKEEIIAQCLSPLGDTPVLVNQKLDDGLGRTVQMLDRISKRTNQRASGIAQNKSEPRLDLTDKDSSSKLNVVLYNRTQIEDGIQSSQDLGDPSIVLHDQSFDAVATLVKGSSNTRKEYRKHEDCSGIYLSGNKSSGIYEIYPKRLLGKRKIKVYCDMTTSGGGWTVIQRRNDIFKPRIDFYRNWSEYKSGFGDLDEEFWLGLENINVLTSSDNYKLRIDLANFDSQRRFAEYSNFSVGDEESQFVLNVAGYSGTAGDSMTIDNEMKFTTKDRDNDLHSEINCASRRTSAWWFRSCSQTNLNGPPVASDGIGIIWFAWNGFFYPLKETEMKIRPAAFD